jgi:hypothetical protein
MDIHIYIYKWMYINREKIARYEELLLEDKELDSTLFAGKSNDPEEVVFSSYNTS